MTTFNAVCSCLIKHTFNFGCCCLQYGGKNTGSRDCKHKWDYHCSTLCIHTNFCIHINFPQKMRRKRGWDTLSVTLHECPRLRHLEMTAQRVCQPERKSHLSPLLPMALPYGHPFCPYLYLPSPSSQAPIPDTLPYPYMTQINAGKNLAEFPFSKMFGPWNDYIETQILWVESWGGYIERTEFSVSKWIFYRFPWWSKLPLQAN